MSDTNTDTTARPDLEAIGKRAEAATQGFLSGNYDEESMYLQLPGGLDACPLPSLRGVVAMFPLDMISSDIKTARAWNKQSSNNLKFFRDAREDVVTVVAYALRLESEIALYRATLPTEASEAPIAANLSQAVCTEAQRGKGE